MNAEIQKQQEEVIRENGIQSASKKQMEFLIESSFHKGQINRLKELLGNKCTYLSHLTRTGKRKDGEWIKGTFHYIKVVLLNELGGKDTVLYEIDGKPSDLNESDYRSLYDQLNSNSYAG